MPVGAQCRVVALQRCRGPLGQQRPSARRPTSGLRGSGLGFLSPQAEAQARTERRAHRVTRRSRGGAVDFISRCQVQDRGGVVLTCAVLSHRTTGADLGDRVDPSGTVRVVREAPISACRQPRLSATDVLADQLRGQILGNEMPGEPLRSEASSGGRRRDRASKAMVRRLQQVESMLAANGRLDQPVPPRSGGCRTECDRAEPARRSCWLAWQG